MRFDSRDDRTLFIDGTTDRQSRSQYGFAGLRLREPNVVVGRRDLFDHGVPMLGDEAALDAEQVVKGVGLVAEAPLRVGEHELAVGNGAVPSRVLLVMPCSPSASSAPPDPLTGSREGRSRVGGSTASLAAPGR